VAGEDVQRYRDRCQIVSAVLLADILQSYLQSLILDLSFHRPAAGCTTDTLLWPRVLCKGAQQQQQAAAPAQQQQQQHRQMLHPQLQQQQR
jgi:hypothetical protein